MFATTKTAICDGCWKRLPVGEVVDPDFGTKYEMCVWCAKDHGQATQEDIDLQLSIILEKYGA